MASAVQKLKRPEMRGLFRAHLKKHMTIAVIAGICSSIAWKYLVMEPRKKAYADFYKTYDAEKDYRRMEATGVLPPIPEFEKRDY